MEMSNIGIEEGRWLKSSDTNKILAGYNYQLDNKIFPKALDIGDKLEVNEIDLEIVGFLEEVGNPADDAQLYTTLEYLEDLYPDDNLSFGMIVAKVDTSNLDRVVENIEKSLRKEKGFG